MNVERHQAVIIGGGPAGLAAAIRLRQKGIDDVVVLEREHRPGGILRQCIHDGFGLTRFGETLSGPEYAQRFVAQAEELGIPVQESVRTGGSTNGAPIHLSNQGVPVIVIGIPVRYIHTHYGIAAHSDVENAAQLAAAILERMDAAQISRF